MIRGEHTIIRAAEPDDAVAMHVYYDPLCPRCCLMDHRREPIFPTCDELREVLAQKEMGRPLMYAVETHDGMVRGFCTLRSINTEARYGEVVIMLSDAADYEGPVAEEALAFLLWQAFTQQQLHKVIAHAMDSETALLGFLRARGFASNGVQREVTYTLGRWHNAETLSLFRPVAASEAGTGTRSAEHAPHE